MAPNTRIYLRRGTAAAWTGADPTLGAGEAGFETDTGKLKLGDGATAWTSLAYFGGGASVLDDLTDVNAPAPSDLDVLTWDSTPGEWIAAPAAGGAPTGSAGGELAGTYPNPTVAASHSGSAHHDPVTVGSGLDVTGQLVELDLSEVASGGELGGFMDAPTVDATHSGSTHAATQAAAEATAASALSGHTGDTSDAHDASAVSYVNTGSGLTATEVQAAIDELDATLDALPGGHDPVTLGSDVDVLLGLSTQQITLDVQNANKVFAGPTSGGDADPTFRALVVADIPAGLPDPSTTLPTVFAIGASATGTGNITPTLPTGHTTNDILLLFVQSDNQTAAAPATYTQLGPVVGIGTAGAALATRLTIFWKRDGGAETDPTVLDTTDHTLAQIMGVRGCPTTGDPFVSVGQTRKTTASVTGTASAGATDTDNCLIVNAFAHGLDSASAVFSSPVNASLGSVTEQIDVATADGNGGGIGVITGTLAVAGPFVATTTTETSTTDVSSTFYMLPADALNLSGWNRVDRQIFTTAGFGDTWTKPTGAKVIEMIGIGGGASGSAGRTASVAAGGGGGGGGAWTRELFGAAQLPATLAVTVGTGGPATANSDGAVSVAGTNSTVDAGALRILAAGGGLLAGVSATGSGGAGGGGGGSVQAPAPAAGAASQVYGSQPAPGGTGGTTAAGGSNNHDFGGGGGAGGGTTQAASAGGNSRRGGGGGGGGRSNTTVGTGGVGKNDGAGNAGGATAGAAGTSSAYPEVGGGGGAGGTSAAGPGGAGGYPGGGGGGGGSQAAAQRGGAGADGVVVIVTYF